MAKKTMSKGRSDAGSKRAMTKLITPYKSPKTGSYAYRVQMVATEEVPNLLKKSQ